MYDGRLLKMPMALCAVTLETAIMGVMLAVTRTAAIALKATKPRTAESTGPRGGFWADIE
jgi:hypothetical protein